MNDKKLAENYEALVRAARPMLAAVRKENARRLESDEDLLCGEHAMMLALPIRDED